MSTADKLRAGADATQGEFEDACWGVLVHAMTHQPAGDRLSLRAVLSEDTFEETVLPTVRRAWERATQALALEALVEYGTPPLDPHEPPDPEDG